MIKQIITEQHITTHKELQHHLSKLSNSKLYWSYPLDIKNELERVGLLDKCVIIELEGIERYYENEKI